MFGAFDDTWDNWRFQIEQYLDAGDTVVVIGRYEATCRATGKPMRSPAAHVYDTADGKITRFRQFTDTKLIWDAMH